MAQKIAQLYAEIGADTTKLDAGLKSSKAGLAGMKDSLAGTSTGLNSFSKMLAPIGGALVATFAFSKIKDFFVSSIHAASDLNETLSKSKVVFGQYSSGIKQMGETAATSMGMSKNAAIAAAATYGNLFTSMGIGQEAAAGMSEKMVRLASDLASFNNIGTDEALEKIRAGLVGESEPLRTLGVMLSQTRIEQEAVNAKLWDGKGIIDAAAKTQAAYNIILKDSVNSQGDFARTSDGMANSARIAQAKLEDLRAEIGEKLIPVSLKYYGVLQEQIDGLSNIIKLNDLEEEAYKRKLYTGSQMLDMELKITFGYMTQKEMIKKLTDAIEADRKAKRSHTEAMSIWSNALTIANDKLDIQKQIVDPLSIDIYGLGDSTKYYLDQLDALHIAEFNLKLQEQAKAADTAALALGGLTSRNMFDTLVSMYNLTAKDEGWWELAEVLGVIKKDTRENVTNWENLITTAKDYNYTLPDILQNVGAINSAINETPTEHTTNFIFDESYSSDFLADYLKSWGPGDKSFTVTTNYKNTGSPTGQYQGNNVTTPMTPAPTPAPGQERYQYGGSFIIPPGYRESWPLGGGRYASSGEMVTVTPITNNFNLTANYPYQSYSSLLADVKALQGMSRRY